MLFETFAAYQLLLCGASDDLLAVGHCVPLVWNSTLPDLPARIDEILLRAEKVHADGQPPNTFSALAAMVSPAQRGQNLSQAIIREMKILTRERGCQSLIAPVRPTWKSHYPLTPMEQYVHWKRPDGVVFNPWFRVHWRMGALPLCIAPATLTVQGAVTEWGEWTNMAFPESGLYLVPGALQPVKVDRELDKGCYQDPNYWMKHTIEAGPLQVSRIAPAIRIRSRNDCSGQSLCGLFQLWTTGRICVNFE